MKNIFNELEQENITYAVCVSLIKSTFDSGISQREYYIIANKKDVAGRYGFTTGSDSGYRNVYERDLSDSERFKFLETMDRYTKVLNNKHGRVYELKGGSFKSNYNKNKQGNKKVTKPKGKQLDIIDLFKSIW